MLTPSRGGGPVTGPMCGHRPPPVRRELVREVYGPRVGGGLDALPSQPQLLGRHERHHGDLGRDLVRPELFRRHGPGLKAVLQHRLLLLFRCLPGELLLRLPGQLFLPRLLWRPAAAEPALLREVPHDGRAAPRVGLLPDLGVPRAGQALALAALRHLGLDLPPQHHHAAVAADPGPDHRLAVQEIPLLDALRQGPRDRGAEAGVHREERLAGQVHELQRLLPLDAGGPREQILGGLVVKRIDAVQRKLREVSRLVGEPLGRAALRVGDLLLQQLLDALPGDEAHPRAARAAAQAAGALLAAGAEELGQALAVPALQLAHHAPAAVGRVAHQLLHGAREHEDQLGVVVAAAAHELALVDRLPDQVPPQRGQHLHGQRLEGADLLHLLVVPGLLPVELQLPRSDAAQDPALELQTASVEDRQVEEQAVVPMPGLAVPVLLGAGLLERVYPVLGPPLRSLLAGPGALQLGIAGGSGALGRRDLGAGGALDRRDLSAGGVHGTTTFLCLGLGQVLVEAHHGGCAVPAEAPVADGEARA